MNQNIIEIRDLKFSWGDNSLPLLDIESLSVNSGARVFIEGPSGSGKTTLLGLLAGVLLSNRGEIQVLDQVINHLGGFHRDRFRGEHIGFIFQMFNLIPYLSIIENVTLPCRFSKSRKEKTMSRSKDLKQEALRLLNDLNMAEANLIDKRVNELSVGQQQRVAAARALIGSPEIIIADEPTSALDLKNTTQFIELLFQECENAGSTLIFVSHDTRLASRFDNIIKLEDINKSDHNREDEIIREALCHL
jgi:putative ABC transport system ATP-binding protein